VKRRGEKNIEAASNLVGTNHATSDECVRVVPWRIEKRKGKKRKAERIR
jgi:hypothetical protein